MVSVFPPNFALTPIFNISEQEIINIIRDGQSEVFYNKCLKLLEVYKDSLGIDEESIPFIKLLKTRVSQVNAENGFKINFNEKLSDVIAFLESVIANRDAYFKNTVLKGREFKKRGLVNEYKIYKTKSISYTAFGTFLTRENKTFRKSSNLLYFDIDVALSDSENSKILEFLKTNPYIRASWYSFSGIGYGFFVKSNWTTEAEFKKVYYKVLESLSQYLKKELGFTKRVFDTQVCSLSRMNIISNGLISENKNSTLFEYEDYSDGLYSLLFTYYKKDSVKMIPNRTLTELDFQKAFNIKAKLNKSKVSKSVDSGDYVNFLKTVTRHLNFEGSDDYNSAIKSFASKVFRYSIEDGIIENFLFSKIPYTVKSEKTYRLIWRKYSTYSDFKSIEPKSYAVKS